jgi:hypothetical protein
MDLFWRENKRFLIGVGIALLAGLLFHQIFIGPARTSAAQDRRKLRQVQEDLARLLETKGQPTDELLERAREDHARLEKHVKVVSADLTVAMPREFMVPKGEGSPGFFFDTQFNRIKSEMRRLAPKAGTEGVRLPSDGKFGFRLAPSPAAAQEFLVRLALVHRLVESAFAAAGEKGKEDQPVVKEVAELQALPGATQGAPVGPPAGTFLQRHPVEMQLRCDFHAFLVLLHGFSQKGNFLAVERVRFAKEDQLAPFGMADFRLSGLTVKADGAIAGSAPGAESDGGGGGIPGGGGGRDLFKPRGRG